PQLALTALFLLIHNLGLAIRMPKCIEKGYLAMTNGRILRGLMTPTIAALILTACGGAGVNSGNASQDLEGLSADASKAEFQEALADMEPVNLTFQTAATSAESLSGQREEAFADAVEDWSGGKITIDVAYSYSVAPVEQVVDALQDGRLDLAHWPTSYHADILPAYASLQESLLSVPSSPLQGEIVTHFV